MDPGHVCWSALDRLRILCAGGTSEIGERPVTRDEQCERELGFRYLISFLDIQPLASLGALVVVPAHKRVVFIAGMDLLASTSWGLFAKRITPWLLTTGFVKDVVGNMSEGSRNGTHISPFGPPRIGDEL
ncbi:uncharacterized protein RCC_06536 [Ramularia collo-cygni]|uniref:Uncharacterized protein n=1 Tax=Ramularia collo-cygni TaxID=112498 RepID=A0A2D3UYY2_9PEZI|nr:uncharacterized protein RCC_06536 [Ramularia collo-cygni]CZT20678.1 uncharacterized protein RCC_06536 [Ramularia collo-cygni]